MIVDDTECSVVAKQNAAIAKGAVGLLVVSAGGTEGLFEPGYYQKLTLPVAVIDRTTDAALRRTTAPVRLTLDAQASVAKSRNVIAQTKTGDTAKRRGGRCEPGQCPAQSGHQRQRNRGGRAAGHRRRTGSRNPRSATRCGSPSGDRERLGAAGKYLSGLDAGELDDIAAYLDADMLGSTNAGFFTYDGDQSAQPSEAPEGSAGIERTLAGYLNLAGVRPADMPMDGTGDYSPFLKAGVPVGGVTTGSTQLKSAVQARIWGGRAGAAFDPQNGTPRDGMDNVDHRALSITGPAMAFAVGTYALSIEGDNGVPARDQRHRRG